MRSAKLEVGDCRLGIGGGDLAPFSVPAETRKPTLIRPTPPGGNLAVDPLNLPEQGKVIAIPQIGGLHHRYTRAHQAA